MLHSKSIVTHSIQAVSLTTKSHCQQVDFDVDNVANVDFKVFQSSEPAIVQGKTNSIWS
jgi:hypothetical protein